MRLRIQKGDYGVCWVQMLGEAATLYYTGAGGGQVFAICCISGISEGVIFSMIRLSIKHVKALSPALTEGSGVCGTPAFQKQSAGTTTDVFSLPPCRP